MSSEYAAFIILIIPFIGAALIPLLNFIAPIAVPYFSVLIGLASALIAFFLPFNLNPGVYFSYEWLPGVLKTGILIDTLSIVPALIATWIGFLVLVYSLGYMKKEENLSRYYSITLLFIGSMVGMSLSDNFVSLFFFWEVMGVCSYLLIGFFYKDPKAADAGAKAFMVTKIGDIGLFASILALYSLTGSFAIVDNLRFAPQIAFPLLAFISFGFILGAIGKSAQVPLHVWLPDAMEAPTTISALIHAATMVNAGVYLLARVYPILSQYHTSLIVIQWIGAITALLGAILATFNYDLKRILAYSTISQLGYMILAVGLGGIFASQFHLFSHAIFKALLFLCAGSVIHELGIRDIRKMGGLLKEMPLTGSSFFVGSLALMGVPILNGFFSKDLIIEQAYEHKAWAVLSIAVISAILTVFYSLRTHTTVFTGKKRNIKNATEAPTSMAFPLAILSFLSFVSWVLIGPLTISWGNSGLEGHIMNWRGLIIETFTSDAFLMTGAAILIGFAFFVYQNHIAVFLRSKANLVLKLTSIGFGFDIIYARIIRLLNNFGSFMSNVFDSLIIEGINKAAISSSINLSKITRSMQTGDIHWNLFYVILTLVFLLGLAL